jgi:hypothetical protein
MSVFDRLFGLAFRRGRLGPAPRGGTTLVAPASVQRAHLGLQEVDPPAGVVTVRGGGLRCVLRVSGFPVQHRSEQEAYAFLAGWAAALNAMPPRAAFLVRSRPGGLAGHVAAKRARALALARTQPGGALAALAADQWAHADRLQREGVTRQTDCYVALRRDDGHIRALLRDAERAAAQLRGAGLRVDLLTAEPLVRAIAESWRPEVTEHFVWPYDEAWHLAYSPGAARVVRPRYVDARGDQGESDGLIGPELAPAVIRGDTARSFGRSDEDVGGAGQALPG